MLEGFGKHVEKGYIYFAMAFALGVELVNLGVRSRKPVHLKQTYVAREGYLGMVARASELEESSESGPFAGGA